MGDENLASLIRRRGHFLFYGWRLWFSLFILLTAGSAFVFVVALDLGNGPVAYKAGIICFVSCILMLLTMRRLP